MASRADPEKGKVTEGERSAIDLFVAPNANLYLRLARQAARSGDVEHAILGYTKCLETWRRGNALRGEKWKREEERTDEEFSAFLMGRVFGATSPPHSSH